MISLDTIPLYSLMGEPSMVGVVVYIISMILLVVYDRVVAVALARPMAPDALAMVVTNVVTVAGGVVTVAAMTVAAGGYRMVGTTYFTRMYPPPVSQQKSMAASTKGLAPAFLNLSMLVSAPKAVMAMVSRKVSM